MSLLELKGITASYGPSQALFGVDLALEAGEVCALMGRNGMGKSTTIKVICRMLKQSGGTVHFNGRDIGPLPSYKAAQAGLGLVPEGRRCFGPLTVYENLIAAARPGPWDFEKVCALFPRLGERCDQIAGSLSGGEQQMLAIGRGMMAEPRLMILDEPSLGLSPLLVEEMFGLIQNLNKTGLSFFLVEQNVMQSLEIANRAYVIENGKIVLSGNTDALLNDPELKKSYLGV